MSLLKVAIAGATGETGGSVANALLASPDRFEITALVRPASVEKKETISLKERGVRILPVDLSGSCDAITEALVGTDVVVCTLLHTAADEQIALATAAKAAGVCRFVLSFFGPMVPPRGVIDMRDKKENVLDHIKRLYLPYTMIDIGWWYQLTPPRLPSGKIDAWLAQPSEIVGDGNARMALTDLRDVGRFVARIITDPRTVNKHVFAHGEVRTQNQVWQLLEKMTGETIPRNPMSAEQLLAMVAEAKDAISKGATDLGTTLQLHLSQYKYSLGIREDNTPEHAKYLGCLDARELYPDFQPVQLEDFVKDLLLGKIGKVYAGRYS